MSAKIVRASRKRVAAPERDTSIETYRAKRDFATTPEPAPAKSGVEGPGLRFVVQKHAAARAGLHWDFRLEHRGVLLSWAVPKGPSMDPADRRMAIHVEDHPLDYADFSGEIPAGGYGAGSVAVWDSGTWSAIDDADTGLAKGHLHFTLQGGRLTGAFSLVRTHRAGRQEAWLLIKGQDDAVRPGMDAVALEAEPQRADPAASPDEPPMPGAKRGALPQSQAVQLCAPAAQPPGGDGWVSEVKFDGYRLLVRIEGSDVRLITRNGHDWTARMPHLAKAFLTWGVGAALLDGELVALDAEGVPSFAGLQAALSDGRDQGLAFYAFDLLHLNGWDLRPATLLARKAALHRMGRWGGALRYSDHHDGSGADLLGLAAERGLEGVIAKRGDAPYRAGRRGAWVKVKCQSRQEFVVLGWTRPAGRRVGIGALQMGFHDDKGRMHYAGGVGTGFSDATLATLRRRLDAIAAEKPRDLVVEGEPMVAGIRWVRPELVAEVEFTGWSGGGRIRHGVFLGLREDKAAEDVVTEEPPGPEKLSMTKAPAAEKPVASPARRGIVVARAPKQVSTMVGGVALSHANRALWPGVTKLDLAEYWQAVAEHALRGIAGRPLAILRCPDGIGGEQFFQKNRGGFLPPEIRDGTVMKQPFLAIDDVTGLVAMAQMSAIELHTWGASETDPQHPDRMVFDLDPGEGVVWDTVVAAARDMQARLETLGLESFCRTSGGKGLHVVAPLRPQADWPAVKAFCRALAETISAEEPKRFVAHTRIADRRGKILIDWLRNGPGATAIASFSPRARPGATVATPLAWREVTAALDPGAFTVRSVPGRLARLKRDPWAGFEGTRQTLPVLPAAAEAPDTPKEAMPPRRPGGSRIVVSKAPRRAG